MSPQEISITHSALGWVKKSIDDNLSESTSDLRRYLENNDAALLESVKQRLAMINGVLMMIEQYGAAMLTEEMVALVDFIVDSEQVQGEQALEVLLRAVLQLPDYLEHIQSGHRDIPIAILPLLNDIRAVRNQDLFSEKLLFLPDLSMHEQAGEAETIDDKSNLVMRQLVKKLRPKYQLALVNIIRDKAVEESLQQLERICAMLEENSASEQVARIWWIVGALIESVSRQQLELGVSVKSLLGKVDALFRVILIIGERGLLQRQPIELIKNFLYYIAQPECDGPKTQAIKTAYRLEQFLPSESARSEVLSNIAGPNQALLKTVAEAMNTDIETVKSTLEVYVNGDLSKTEVLADLPQEMHIISDTLAMIGLGAQRQLIEAQIEVVKQILDGEIVADEARLLSMAAELLQVEQALEQMQKRQPVNLEQSQSDADVSHDYELDSVLSAVVSAALDNVQKTKDAILEFVKDPQRVANIDLCINLVEESRGALTLLEQPHAVAVVDDLLTYLRDYEIAAFVQTDQLEALSQVVASLEYYLEALGERRSDADRILGMAETRLRQLLATAGKKSTGAPAAVLNIASAAPETAAVPDQPVDAGITPPTPAVPATSAQDEAESTSFDDTVVVDAGATAADAPTQVIRVAETSADAAESASGFTDTVVVSDRGGDVVPDLDSAPAQSRSTPSDSQQTAGADQPAAATSAAKAAAQKEPYVVPIDEALEVLKSGSDPEILEIYLEEAAEESANIARLQKDWLLHPEDENALKNMRRAFHTIKGSGRLVGATKIGEFAWDFEQLLNRVIDKTVPPSKQVINAVGGAARALPELVQELTTFEEPRADVPYLRGLARALAEFKTEQLLIDHTQTMSIVESPDDHITDDADDEPTQVIAAGFGATTQIISSASALPQEPPAAANAALESGPATEAGDPGETRPGSESPVVADEAVVAADDGDLSQYDSTELTDAPPLPDLQERRRIEAEARAKIAAAARARTDAAYERAPDYSRAEAEADVAEVAAGDEQVSAADGDKDLSKYENTELTEAPPVPDLQERRRIEAEARAKIAAAARARADAAYERAPDYAGEPDVDDAEMTAADGQDSVSTEVASTSAEKIEIESMGDDFVGEGVGIEFDDQRAIDALPSLASLGDGDDSSTSTAETPESVEASDPVTQADAQQSTLKTSVELEAEALEMGTFADPAVADISMAAPVEAEVDEIETISPDESNAEAGEMVSPAEPEAEEIEMVSPIDAEAEPIELAWPDESEAEEIEMVSMVDADAEALELAWPDESEAEEIEMTSPAEQEVEQIEMTAPADSAADEIEITSRADAEADEIEIALSAESEPQEQLRRAPPDPLAVTTATPTSGVAAEGSGSKDREPPEPTGLSFAPELLTIYQQEVEQHLGTVSSALDHAEKTQELVPSEALYRALHTIHGASRTADIGTIGELAGLLEKPLKTAIGQGMALDHEIVALYRVGERALREMTQQLVVTHCMPAIPEDLKISLRALAEDFEEYTVDLTEDDSGHSGDFIDTLTMMNDSASSEQDDELLDIFVDEANELLEMSDNTLHQWAQQNSNDPGAQDYAAVMELQRYLHTLKGGARMAELNPISDLSHEMESLFIAVIDGRVDKSDGLLDLLRDSFDLLHQQVAQAQRGETMTAAAELVESLHNLRLEEDETADAASFDNVADVDVDSESIDIVSENLPGKSSSDLDRAGNDVIKVRADLLDNLVSSAGEVSIYRARMEQQVAGLGSHLGELGQTIARLKLQLRSLEAETDAQLHFSHRSEQQRSGDFDPLEMDRYTLIQELSRSLGESVNDLSSLQGMLGDQVRDSETLLLQQSKVSTDLQDGLIKSRMVRFSGLLSRLRRLVRQSSQELGKKAELTVTGEQNEVDNKVLDRMVAPLEHIIRNALSHGIETPVERVRKGKPETGNIAIDITRDGSDVVLRVSDDGAGVDIEKVRNRAIQQGLLEAGYEASDSELVQFILEPGFSTAEHVTQLSGRGVGMDVVDIEVKQLGGTLQIETTPQGTTFVARLPFTLSINQAILVRSGNEIYAIPLLNIEGITRIDAQQMHDYYREDSPQIEYAGQEFTLHNLAKLVGAEHLFRPGEVEKQPVILGRAGDIRVALHVDEILGNREIVVKNLGKQLSQVKSLAGASILADGSMVLILDIGGLIRQQLGSTVKVVYQAVTEPAEKLQNTVLVVDDSITMRRVASKLLERHNYEVITAKDGVDALAQLQEVVPDVVLLDVEMPRMDGFELASHMQNEASFSKIPIIMITSRTGEKHRDRAFQIGVTNYMGKPYQEDELIENIQSALGGARAQA